MRWYYDDDHQFLSSEQACASVAAWQSGRGCPASLMKACGECSYRRLCGGGTEEWPARTELSLLIRLTDPGAGPSLGVVQAIESAPDTSGVRLLVSRPYMYMPTRIRTETIRRDEPGASGPSPRRPDLRVSHPAAGWPGLTYSPLRGLDVTVSRFTPLHR